MNTYDELARDATRSDEAHLKTEAELLRQRDYAESIIDTVRDPLLILDKNLRVESASRSFYEVFSLGPEVTIGELIYDVGDGEWNIPALRQLLEGVLPQAGSFREFEVVQDFQLLGRRVMHLDGRTLKSSKNNTEHIYLIIKDVTERKRVADDLLRLNQELAKANEELQRFTYVVSHDLRAPVTSALRNLQLLTLRVEGKLNKEATEILAESVECIKRLGALTIDLLMWADLSTAPKELTLVPVKESLAIAVANLQHHLTRSGAIVTMSEMPVLLTDRTPLAMVFQNLIGNAIKYRRADHPHIRIDAIKEGSSWQFSVADNGQGFKPEYASMIFETFKRLHAVNVPGSGIGLATCKRTIERLGGTIWATSIPDKGSTFYFTLPA